MGLDFICYDKKVQANGGVHVIQAFLADSLSEEIQIKGRTARQAQKGSYQMVMYLEDLKRDLSIEWATIESHVNQGGDSLYNFLNEKRNLAKTALDSSRRAHVEAAAAAHERSLAYA